MFIVDVHCRLVVNVESWKTATHLEVRGGTDETNVGGGNGEAMVCHIYTYVVSSTHKIWPKKAIVI